MTKLGALVDMQGADAEYARRILVAGPGNLETFTQQARTRATRDAYALAVSHGTLRYRELVVRLLFEAGHKPIRHPNPTKQFDSRALLSLARVVANQAATPDDTYESVQMFKTVVRLFGPKFLNRTDRLMMVEGLASLGYVKDVERYCSLLKIGALDRNQANMLSANALAGQESSTHSARPSSQWLDYVNAGYRRSGIETISFAPGEGALIDRILSGPSEHVEDGPKVTVIVPTFNSGARITTALRSLVNQTWRNIEILVMDDASPEENDVYLREWEARDSRIRIHKMSENGGTYRARNYALTHLATGELVTVHDDDDWSHPRKIETQVRHLMDNPQLVANMSLLSRATPDLVFTRINNNPVFTQPNYSSLMFWRGPVLERVGYWDLVNRSADAEFHDRLKTAFEGGVGIAGTDALSFLRVRADSLTSGEIARGYIDRRRIWYQQSSRNWHSAAKEVGSALFMEAFPAPEERPFSAPVDMVGSRATPRIFDVDVLYVTDFRFPGGNSSVASTEVRLLIEAGYRVGLMQMTSPVNAAQASIQPIFLELAQSPRVSVVSTLDNVRASLTLVRHPSVLQFAEEVRSGAQTDELVVIVNHAPFTTDGLGSIYDLSQVTRNARTIFGRAARFAPESDLIRENMRGAVVPSMVLRDSWPGVVMGAGAGVDEQTPPPPARVVGRHSRDHLSKWPETADRLLASYPERDDYEVRILGGAKTATDLLGRTPKNWTVLPFGSMSPREFLQDLPFWVYQHNSSLTESFGMAAAEAMAAGCVVVLPPYMRASFGEGAVYSTADGVVSKIEEFIANPAEYYAQRRRAAIYAAERFSAQAFIDRVRNFTDRENG